MSLNNLKTFTCAFVLALFMQLPLLAQQEAVPFTAKNAVFLEFGGNGVLLSLNYERVFYQKGAFKSAARLGFSAIPNKIETDTYWNPAIPLELVGLLGRSRHHLEVGIGYTAYIYAESKLEVGSRGEEFDGYQYTSLVPFRIGYRYQKPEGGLFFRAAYMPALDFTPDRDTNFVPFYGGISIGRSF